LMKNSELFHGIDLNETGVHKSAQPSVYWTTRPTGRRSKPERQKKAMFCFLWVFLFFQTPLFWHKVCFFSVKGNFVHVQKRLEL
jgi:hypothetical protein